jgi:hypothetical protein
MSLTEKDYIRACDALMPFVEKGWIQCIPEELELIAHSILLRYTYEQSEALIATHIDDHQSMDRDIEHRTGH